MRYFIHLAYLGTKYSGWQRQINTDLSVQQILENKIFLMTGIKASVMGCGRTDAGVHAMQFFAHADLQDEWGYDPVERLNRMLPKDISIFELIPVHPTAHTRFDAIRRSYEFHVHFVKNPYLSMISTHYENGRPDIELIKLGLEVIKSMNDFRFLCLTPDKVNNTLCTIFDAQLFVSEDCSSMYFKFTANRFLKSMIRIIVARLMALGTGILTMEQFEDVCSGRQIIPYKAMAYPQGLHLTEVIYPYLERESTTPSLLRK